MLSEYRTFAANMDTIPQIMEFIEGLCRDLPKQAAFNMTLVCEEIIVNIVSYAYPEFEGELSIRWKDDTDKRTLMISFEDAGIPFNPLLKEAPDLNAPLAERKIGGLGIMMVRKLTDTVQYAYSDGKNILAVIKRY